MSRKKETSTAFRLPLSGEILGTLIEALQIRTGRLGNKTARRLFLGERVSEDRRMKIYEDFARVLVETEFIPHLPFLMEKGISLTRLLSFVIASQADRWDKLGGYMRTSSPQVTRKDLAPVPYLRFAVIDLALRTTSVMRLAGLPKLAEGEPIWSRESNSGQMLREFQAQCRQKGLTREKFAEKLGVSDNTVDSWLSGRSRPSQDNIQSIAKVLASYLVETTVEVLSARLNRHYILCTLSDLLSKHIGREAVVGLSYALVRFANRLIEGFQQYSKLPPDQAAMADVFILLFGTQFTSSEYLLRHLWRKETDSVWRADLQAAQKDWHRRLQLDAQYIGSFEEDVERAQEKFGISKSMAQSIVEKSIKNLQGDLRLSSVDLEGKTVIRIKGDAKFSAGNRIIQAMHARAEGDFDTALVHFRRAVELQPLNAEYHFQLGATLGQAGKIEEGIQECWISTQLEPNWNLPRVEISIILINSGRYEEALQHLAETSRALGEVDWHLALNLGYAKMQCNDPVGALELFEQVIATRPDHALALDCAAHCCFQIGDGTRGRALAKRANQFGASDTYRDWRTGKYKKN